MPGLAFFTGFPGFIGKRLVRKLLADDPELRVAALVEPNMVERARAASDDLADGDRIEILPGDIGERDLGLPVTDLDRLKAETKLAFHLAAMRWSFFP